MSHIFHKIPKGFQLGGNMRKNYNFFVENYFYLISHYTSPLTDVENILISTSLNNNSQITNQRTQLSSRNRHNLSVAPNNCASITAIEYTLLIAKSLTYLQYRLLK